MNPSMPQLAAFFTLLLVAAGDAQNATHKVDVTDVTVIRRVEQHPQAWRVWQPSIFQGEKKRQLVVAFGAMVNGKKDMGDTEQNQHLAHCRG